MTSENDHDGMRELLDALRAEYRGDVGVDDLPPESLEDCDAETREATRWVQNAWALERATDADSSVSVPLALARAAVNRQRRGRRLRTRRVAAVLTVAAAAAVAAVLVWRGAHSTPAAPPDTPIAQVAPSPDDPTLEPNPERRDFGPRSFRSRDDGVELVSGSVRLVLLHRGD